MAAIPINPLRVIGKNVHITFSVNTSSACLIQTSAGTRMYRLRLCGGCDDIKITSFSNRPNRVVHANISPTRFASLWRSTLPNIFSADPPDALFFFTGEQRKVKCLPRGGGGGRCAQGGRCTEGCCGPALPCVFAGLIGGASINADRSLDLHFQLSQDVTEFPLETRFLSMSISVNDVFVPPIGAFRLDITPTRTCPIFSGDPCDSNAASAMTTTFSVLFSDEGNTIEFSDPIDNRVSIRRFTAGVTYSRAYFATMLFHNGTTVNDITLERDDEVGENKFRPVWIWTFASAETPPDWLPDSAFVSRWTFHAVTAEPTTAC